VETDEFISTVYTKFNIYILIENIKDDGVFVLNKAIKVLVGSAMVLSISVPVFAGTWYSTSLVLPRTGSMTTTVRKATTNSQETEVTNNKYEVDARIDTSSGVPLSSWGSHRAWESDIITHNTGTKTGDSIKAEFKTSGINYFTTSATIAWRP
jgi:hypothetical protein